jgi:hypothetical protein
VRRAVIRALSHRTEVQRLSTLALARDLDPNEEVRSLARAALDGRDIEPLARVAFGVEPRRSVAWVAVVLNDGKGSSAAQAARVVRGDGLAVPVIGDPDGVFMVPGLPAGPVSLLLSEP